MSGNIARLALLLSSRKAAASLDIGAVLAVGTTHATVAVGTKTMSAVKIPGSLLGSIKSGQTVRIAVQENLVEIVNVLSTPGPRPKAMVTFASTAIPDSTTTTADFSGATINYETVSGMVDTANDAIRIIVPGYYRAYATVMLEGDDTGNRLLEIKKGSTVYASTRPGAPTTATMHMSVATPPVLCAVNDLWRVDTTLGTAGEALDFDGYFSVAWDDYGG